jgi:hypothetical protein
VCSRQRRMAGAGVMEIVMSKAPMRNSEVSPDVHELGDDELDRVSGGRTVGGFPAGSAGALGYTMHIPQGVPVPPTPRPVR